MGKPITNTSCQLHQAPPQRRKTSPAFYDALISPAGLTARQYSPAARHRKGGGLHGARARQPHRAGTLHPSPAASSPSRPPVWCATAKPPGRARQPAGPHTSRAGRPAPRPAACGAVAPTAAGRKAGAPKSSRRSSAFWKNCRISSQLQDLWPIAGPLANCKSSDQLKDLCPIAGPLLLADKWSHGLRGPPPIEHRCAPLFNGSALLQRARALLVAFFIFRLIRLPPFFLFCSLWARLVFLPARLVFLPARLVFLPAPPGFLRFFILLYIQ